MALLPWRPNCLRKAGFASPGVYSASMARWSLRRRRLIWAHWSFRLGVHLGWGVAGSSGSEAKAERGGKKSFQAKNGRLALGLFRPFGTCGLSDRYPMAEAWGYSLWGSLAR